MKKSFKQRINTLIEIFFQSHKVQTYTPAYRLVEIGSTETNEYIVTVQVINKSAVFQAKPEEILADDALVDLFSPRDIRTLTYLGYLTLNSPHYRILAQRLSEQHDVSGRLNTSSLGKDFSSS